MSKLTRAQSKTGKTGVIERKVDDKPEKLGLRVDRPADTIKKGRKKFKGKYFAAKRGKGPDGHRSK